MDLQAFIALVGQYGYGALFVCLWFGIVMTPLPDEAIVMTGGLVTALGILQPIPAFLVTWCGVVSGLTLGYSLGRLLGSRGVDRLKRRRWQRPLSTSLRLIQRYGPVALCFSYFFPVVRHLVPYLVGSGKMRCAQYLLYSCSTGCLWTLLYFTLGYCFGSSLPTICSVVEGWGWWMLGGLGVGGLGYLLAQRMRGRRHGDRNDSGGGRRSRYPPPDSHLPPQ